MSENLTLFENSLRKKFTDLENRQQNDVKNLKIASSELKKLPNGSTAAKTLNKYVTDSKKINDKNKKLGLEALKNCRKQRLFLILRKISFDLNYTHSVIDLGVNVRFIY